MRVLVCLLLCIVPLYSFAEELPAGTLFAGKIIDLESDEVIYEQNPDLLLLPASSQKLVTLYSALRLMDVEQSFRTSILTDGQIKDGKVHGNIYFKFRGDPEFTIEKLEQMVESLKSLKIKAITKDIVIDDSEYDSEYFGHGWAIDQTKFCFSAPISAIMIDRNCYKVNINKAGKNVDFKSDKFPSFAKILNKSKCTEANNLCEFELRAFGDNSYVLDGCYQKKDLPPALSIAVQDPRKNALELINYIMKAKNISFKSIKMGNAPSKTKEIAFYNSRPIKELLKDMVKDSDNIISETIFKRISAQNTDFSGGWKNSSKLVTDLLVQDLDISKDQINVKDGSGASRKDLISPNIFIKILKAAYTKDDTKDCFVGMLPVAGVDGTLKNRFKDTHLEKILVAKTGTLDNVSTLSGFAFMPSGKKYAFSLMTNNSLSSLDKIKKFEEDLLTNLLTN